jgi:molybdopterin-guanine dinucleotide biosynthesis protein B
MTQVVSFIGHHNSGKTTLLAQVITIFLERGFRVGAVKHAPHLDDMDSPDTDSAILREAGAEQTLLISDDTCALFWDPDPDKPIERLIERLFAGYDLVLVEGYKHGPFPKIEVYRHLDTRADPLAGEVDVIAVITKDKVALPDGVSVLSPKRPDEIADFLEAHFLDEMK